MVKLPLNDEDGENSRSGAHVLRFAKQNAGAARLSRAAAAFRLRRNAARAHRSPARCTKLEKAQNAHCCGVRERGVWQYY